MLQKISKLRAGNYNSSPVYEGWNIYFTSTNRETLMIIKECRKLEITAMNKSKGETFATPAITNRSIIIRAGTNLICIANNGNSKIFLLYLFQIQ
jgi:hypothetical protein